MGTCMFFTVMEAVKACAALVEYSVGGCNVENLMEIILRLVDIGKNKSFLRIYIKICMKFG
jgi:hypothetical protein